jgi:hypothetical protein
MAQETTAEGQFAIRLKPDASALAQAFAANHEVRMEFQADSPAVYLDLPGKALVDMLKQTEAGESGRVITFAVNGTVFQLPLRWLNGFTPKLDTDSTVTIVIQQAAPSTVSSLSAALAQQKAELIGSPVSFSIEINGQPSESLRNRYTNMYMKKTIALPAPADPAQSAVVWVDSHNGIHFAPAVFHEAPDEAVMYSLQNGLFAAISSLHAFVDLNGHWAKDDIELMANKWIVRGESGTSFSPDTPVTRAELAVLLVRSLGLIESESGADSSFADVSPKAWYAGAVRTARAAGFITGYDDGTFRPDALITREQLAVIIARALSFTGKTLQTDKAALEALSDADAIAARADDSVAKLLESGLIQGSVAAGFSPKEPATRAESTVILKWILQYLEFINS